MGCWHPDFLLQRLNARQLAEWEAYYQLEPHGEQRQDWQMARICQILANVNRDSKKTPTPYSEKDFLFDFIGAEKKPQTADEMKSILRGMKKGKK